MACLAARPASAQLFETVGVRAQGMAGAFVAVADDSTATWWNPAGLATGPFFSGMVERGYARRPSEETRLGVSFAIPSLGLSYYRLRASEILTPASTGSAGGGRQADGAGVSSTFLIHQVGATVGQSIGDHLVVASTLKLVRADEIKGDVDMGAMVKFASARVGFVVKHLHQPDVTVNGVRLEAFDRQIRIGAAFVPQPGPLTVNTSLDADLTATPTVFGNARHLAGGGELWFRRRLGVRGGVSVNTIDELRQSLSAGASIAFQTGLFVDGFITRGDDEALEGWGVALRVTF